MIVEMEKWKQVPGFDNYLVSDLGRVRSINARKGARCGVNGGILSGWVQHVRPGYSRQLMALRQNGRTHIKKVHRLVLEAFVGPCPAGMEACHLNGKALDNRLANLRWGTHVSNVLDSIAHGTKSRPPVRFGPKHHKATLTSKQIRVLQTHVYARGDQARLARKYGVADITIRRIRKGLSRQFG